MRIILASASPRRRELLLQLGVDFQVRVPPDVDESVPAGRAPDDVVREIAERKARAARDLEPDALLIACDTLVFCEGAALGKPADREQAAEFLRRLSGREHEVWSGLCVSDPTRARTGAVRTRVRMRHLDADEIAGYAASGEGLDKAGGYGIQGGRGALLISEIHGDYYNVVGLPLVLLYEFFRDFGIDLLSQPQAGVETFRS